MSFTDRPSPSQAIGPWFTQLLTSGTEVSPVLTFHIHFIDESLLLLSPNSPPPCPRPFSAVHFCSTPYLSGLDYDISLLTGLTLSSPASSWHRVITPHSTYKCLSGSLSHFARKSSNSLLWSTNWCDCIYLSSTSLWILLPLITPLQPQFSMVSIRSPTFFFTWGLV